MTVSNRLLIRNVAIAPMDEAGTFLPRGYLLIEDGQIAHVGTEPPPPSDTVPEMFDGESFLALPGLINTHNHLYQILTRGLPAVQGAELFDWLVGLYPIWARLDEEAVYWSAAAALSELALSGCTTASDMYYIFPRGRSIDLGAVVRAAQDVGLRIHAGRGSMSLGRSAGGLPPDELVQEADAILRDTRRAIEQYHDPKPGALVRIEVHPCSPFSVTPELMRDSAALARGYEQVNLHTHLCETLDEERFCREKFGKRPLEYVAELGWLGEDVYFGHGIHFNAEEIALLGRTRCGVAHCPSSNIRLGSGFCPVREHRAAGVRVGLAVDGSSSNDGANLLREARSAWLVGRLREGVGYSPRIPLELATRGGAAVLNRPELGSLEVGKQADFLLFDLRGVASAGFQVTDPLAGLVMGHAPNPTYVFVGGNAIVREGQLVHLDERRVAAEANRAARRLIDGA